MPNFEDSAVTGRTGIYILGAAVSKLGWILREQSDPDTGVDCHIETRDANRKATGRLIGVQVKSGSSYFSEKTPSGYVYRSDSDHLAYWLGHSLPVIVALVDTHANVCYWQVVNNETVTRTAKGWKLEVPESQTLTSDHTQTLENIASYGWLERSHMLTSPERFFMRVGSNPLFDYQQELRGRTQNLAELDKFLTDSTKTVAILPGRGGIGKSRLIKQWALAISPWTMKIKKETVSVSDSGEKELAYDRLIVVVDDAHRHRDLDTLLQAISDVKQGGTEIKVLLACRPAGIDRLDAALSRSFDPSTVERLTALSELSQEEVRDLAGEVLGAERAHLVPYLVSVSHDTPLVTVVGGRMLKREESSVRHLPDEEEFRHAVFDKFLDEFEILASRTSRNVRFLLYIVAALQPLSVRNRNFIEKCARFLGWRDFELRQSVDALETAGLLVRTGRQFRIVPDMFADFLLEQACVGNDSLPTGYADGVFDEFGNDYLSNLLLNLAELDFRIVGKGQTSILENVWCKVDEAMKRGEAYDKLHILNAIGSTAYYQPLHVLQIVRSIMHAPKQEQEAMKQTASNYCSYQHLVNALPPLLQAVAYHPIYRDEAIHRLWDLAKQDKREPNSHPEHALRVLKHLAAYSRYKAIDFNLEVARVFCDLALRWRPISGQPTPFDIIDELLEREGDEQESAGRTIVLKSFGLNYQVVAPVRSLCLSTLKDCLASEMPANACRAFRSLSDLAHGFLPKFGRPLSAEEVRWHSEERSKVLAILQERVDGGRVSIPLARQIVDSMEDLRWRSPSELSSQVDALLQSMPRSADIDAFDAFCSGNWHIRESTTSAEEINHAVSRNSQKNRDASIAFRQQFSSVEMCLRQLSQFHDWCEECSIKPEGAIEFVHNLCEESEFLTNLSRGIVAGDLNRNLIFSAQVVIVSLRERSASEYEDFALAVARQCNLDLVRSLAAGMRVIKYEPPFPEDFSVLDELRLGQDWYVLDGVIWALTWIGKDPSWRRRAIETLLLVDVRSDKKLADSLCDAFLYNRIPATSLEKDDVDRILGKLVAIPDLTEHGTNLWLSWAAAAHPSAVIEFLKKRIQRGLDCHSRSDWGYRIIPRYGQQVNLRDLTAAPGFQELQSYILQHVETQGDPTDELVLLFWQVSTFNDEAMAMLRPLLKSGEKTKFDSAMRVLGRVPGKVAFSNKEVVLEIMNAAQELGEETLTRTLNILAANVQPTFFHGTPGAAPPTLSQIRSDAEAELSNPELNPLLRRLYETIKKNTDVKIESFLDDEGGWTED